MRNLTCVPSVVGTSLEQPRVRTFMSISLFMKMYLSCQVCDVIVSLRVNQNILLESDCVQFFGSPPTRGTVTPRKSVIYSRITDLKRKHNPSILQCKMYLIIISIKWLCVWGGGTKKKTTKTYVPTSHPVVRKHVVDVSHSFGVLWWSAKKSPAPLQRPTVQAASLNVVFNCRKRLYF